MTFVLGRRSMANLNGPPPVHPKLILLAQAAIRITTVDFGFAAKQVRTAEEQFELFKRGVSKMDGYKRISNHQVKADGFGYAIDAVAWVNGAWDHDDWEHYFKIASAFSKASKQLGFKIVWGGNWRETMDQYGSEVIDMRNAVERYKRINPGPDFIDGPHYELRG